MLLEDKSVLESIKKRIWFSFVASILLIIFAVVLLINPDNFIPTAINVFGYVAIFLGILNAVFYFRLPKESRIYSKNLSTSINLILGFLIIVNPFTNVSINLYLGIMVIVSASLIILENILLLIGFRKYKNHEEVVA